MKTPKALGFQACHGCVSRARRVGAAVFLASKASAFITGQVLYVDGGTSCGLFWPIQV